MIELKDLIGNHELSGVDREVKKIHSSLGVDYEDCDVIRFVLDDIIYAAIEDPDDGYRSSMREILISNEAIINSFPKVKILGKMKPGDNETLELFDVENGKLVLAVGTKDYNDYYPCWVAMFIPENMSINEKHES